MLLWAGWISRRRPSGREADLRLLWNPGLKGHGLEQGHGDVLEGAELEFITEDKHSFVLFRTRHRVRCRNICGTDTEGRMGSDN